MPSFVFRYYKLLPPIKRLHQSPKSRFKPLDKNIRSMLSYYQYCDNRIPPSPLTEPKIIRGYKSRN